MNAAKLILTCKAMRVFSASTWTGPMPETAASTASKVARTCGSARAFDRYDEAAGAWIRPSGEFTVRIGRSSADLPLYLRVKSF